MLFPQNDFPLLRLQEVKRVNFTDGIRRSGDGDEAKFSGGAQDCVPVGWVERLDFVEEERYGAIVAAQLIFQEQQVEQHFDSDGCAVRLNLPEVMIGVPSVICARHGKAESDQVGEADDGIIL